MKYLYNPVTNDLDNLEDAADKAYSAGQKVYGAATNVAGSAVSQVQGAADASTKDTTLH